MFRIQPIASIVRGFCVTGRRALPIVMLVVLSLACGWGAQEARAPRPDPTRVPQPTFTPTLLPPTATPVPTDTPVLPPNAPLATHTLPLPSDTSTPVPTHTPVPPTATPVPPTATPVPPTATPAPPTATSMSLTPVLSPTLAAATPGPPTHFQLISAQRENNCYNLGVSGLIRDANGRPLPGITIEVVKGDRTFKAISFSDGRYSIHLGSLADYPEGSKWHVYLKEGQETVSDKLEWETSRNCNDPNKIQILRLEWKREP